MQNAIELANQQKERRNTIYEFFLNAFNSAGDSETQCVCVSGDAIYV